jgi:hypothetical protein
MEMSSRHMSASDSVIGGVFGWVGPAEHQGPFHPLWDQNKHLMLANARSAIHLLIEFLRPANIWLPSYLCDSILLGLEEFKEQFNFYPVNSQLEISDLIWLNAVSAGDLVLLIDYFGWRPDTSTIDQIHATGAMILEDASQALLTDGIGESVEYSVFSPRKFLPVPDGGILCAIDDSLLPNPLLQESPDSWWYQAFQAVILRGQFDQHHGDRSWFKLFQASESAAPVGHYAISEFSRRALRFVFDYAAIASARVRNYLFLAEHLSEFAIHVQVPPGTVPLGFPIRLSERDLLRQRLFDHEIFPAIHWAVPSAIPMRFVESRELANEIMTLPCDQRYAIDDMRRMVDIILAELKK